jgi:spermidine/putrescine transport system permease protein
MKEKRWQPWVLLSPSLSAIFFFMVVPIGFIVVYSFWIRASTGADIPAFQLGNYQKFFEDYFYPWMLLRTLRIALETVLLCVVFGYSGLFFLSNPD